MFKVNKGFTLIEIVMTIIILGILGAIVAIPRLFDLTDSALIAAEKGIVGGVRTSLYSYYANYRSYPPALDTSSNGPCTRTNPCFTTVLGEGGITKDWIKSGNAYTGPAGTLFTYDPIEGTFM